MLGPVLRIANPITGNTEKTQTEQTTGKNAPGQVRLGANELGQGFQFSPAQQKPLQIVQLVDIGREGGESVRVEIGSIDDDLFPLRKLNKREGQTQKDTVVFIVHCINNYYEVVTETEETPPAVCVAVIWTLRPS